MDIEELMDRGETQSLELKFRAQSCHIFASLPYSLSQ